MKVTSHHVLVLLQCPWRCCRRTWSRWRSRSSRWSWTSRLSARELTRTTGSQPSWKYPLCHKLLWPFCVTSCCDPFASHILGPFCVTSWCGPFVSHVVWPFCVTSCVARLCHKLLWPFCVTGCVAVLCHKLQWPFCVASYCNPLITSFCALLWVVGLDLTGELYPQKIPDKMSLPFRCVIEEPHPHSFHPKVYGTKWRNVCVGSDP